MNLSLWSWILGESFVCARKLRTKWCESNLSTMLFTFYRTVCPSDKTCWKAYFKIKHTWNQNLIHSCNTAPHTLILIFDISLSNTTLQVSIASKLFKKFGHLPVPHVSLGSARGKKNNEYCAVRWKNWVFWCSFQKRLINAIPLPCYSVLPEWY